MRNKIDKIEDFMVEQIGDCLNEINSDLVEGEDFSKWNKLKALEYLINYLDLEHNSLKQQSKKRPNLIVLK